MNEEITVYINKHITGSVKLRVPEERKLTLLNFKDNAKYNTYQSMWYNSCPSTCDCTKLSRWLALLRQEASQDACDTCHNVTHAHVTCNVTHAHTTHAAMLDKDSRHGQWTTTSSKTIAGLVCKHYCKVRTLQNTIKWCKAAQTRR